MLDVTMAYNRHTGEWLITEWWSPQEPGVGGTDFDQLQSHTTRGRGLGSLLGALEQATMGFGEQLPPAVREEGPVGRRAGTSTGSGSAGQPS